jgi:hypothetical protein
MRGESREVWQKRVERWSDGGLSAAEFAAEIGVNPRTLTYWKWRFGSEAKKATKPRDVAAEVRPMFVEVARPAPQQSERFELVIGDLVVRVPAAFDADELKRIVAAVRA